MDMDTDVGVGVRSRREASAPRLGCLALSEASKYIFDSRVPDAALGRDRSSPGHHLVVASSRRLAIRLVRAFAHLDADPHDIK